MAQEIVLRAYIRPQRSGGWYAHCITLSLDAVGADYREARDKLDDAILSYLRFAGEENRFEELPRRSCASGSNTAACGRGAVTGLLRNVRQSMLRGGDGLAAAARRQAHAQGECGITASTAEGLASAFGTTWTYRALESELWLNLDAAWERHRAQGARDDAIPVPADYTS